MGRSKVCRVRAQASQIHLCKTWATRRIRKRSNCNQVENDLRKLNDRLIKWHMKLAGRKYKVRSVRNTNPSHTKTIRSSKLTSVGKETSESPSLLKTPAHCSLVVNKVKKSFRNDYRMKREWKSDHFQGIPASNTACSSAYTEEDGGESVKTEKRWHGNVQWFP